MFGAPGGWWNDVAWDIGVLAVRPGGALGRGAGGDRRRLGEPLC